MYKKITHTIVQEHFDHPSAASMSKEIKSTWKAPLRYYPNGEQMSSNLPPSFRVATDSKYCGNCLAFNPATFICAKWSALVRPEYVCDAWTAIPS
jgi:hypothetical protein